MIERIQQLREDGEAQIAGAGSAEELGELRVRLLGRKAELPRMLRGVAALEPSQRAAVGQSANEARHALEEQIQARATRLAEEELGSSLQGDVLDVTLPGAPAHPVGRLHLLTVTRRELEDIFLGLGFTVMEGPEVETVHYNFDALNHSPTHPARERSDTFYVAPGGDELGDRASEPADGTRAPSTLLLRTHTSPMQVRVMESHPPPLYVIIPGRVY